MPIAIVPEHRSSRLVWVIVVATAVTAWPSSEAPTASAPAPWIEPAEPIDVPVFRPPGPRPPIAPAAPVVDLDACPAIAAAPDREIGPRIDAPAEPLDAPVLGVATSPSAPGVIAAWTATRVLTSSDDGATWRSVLARRDEVAGAAVDCHGAVWALRGWKHLGVIDRDGSTRWHTVPAELPDYAELDPAAPYHREPYRDPAIVVSGGGVVAVIEIGTSRHALAATADRGASWVVKDLFTDSETGGHTVSIDHHGTWRGITTWFDCMSGGQTILAGPALRPRTRAVPALESGAFPGADGWVYTSGYNSRECPADLCALRPGTSTWHPVAGLGVAPAGQPSEPLAGAIGAGQTILVSRDQLYRARAGRVTELGAALPSGSRLVGVDAGGRVYAIDGSGLLRWSPRHGWRRILDHDDDPPSGWPKK